MPDRPGTDFLAEPVEARKEIGNIGRNVSTATGRNRRPRLQPINPVMSMGEATLSCATGASVTRSCVTLFLPDK